MNGIDSVISFLTESVRNLERIVNWYMGEMTGGYRYVLYVCFIRVGQLVSCIFLYAFRITMDEMFVSKSVTVYSILSGPFSLVTSLFPDHCNHCVCVKTIIRDMGTAELLYLLAHFWA